MDYIIKDKTFLESVMDTEFYDTTETGIFYKGTIHFTDNRLKIWAHLLKTTDDIIFSSILYTKKQCYFGL